MSTRIDYLRRLIRSLEARVHFIYHSELEKLHDLYTLQAARNELAELEGTLQCDF